MIDPQPGVKVSEAGEGAFGVRHRNRCKVGPAAQQVSDGAGAWRIAIASESTTAGAWIHALSAVAKSRTSPRSKWPSALS